MLIQRNLTTNSFEQPSKPNLRYVILALMLLLGSLLSIALAQPNIQWTRITSLDNTQYNDVACLPNGVLLTAKHLQGIYRSTDLGVTWQLSNNGLSGIQQPAGFFVRGDTVLFQMWGGNGVYRSFDAGITWEFIGLHTSISSLYIHPNGTYFAGSWRADWWDGAYRSINRGGAWTSINSGLHDWPLAACFIASFDSSVMLLSTQQAVYRSTNLGDLWTPTSMTTPGRRFAVHPISHEIYFSQYSDMQKTSDNGTTWQIINTGLPTERDIADLFVGRNGHIYIGCIDVGVYVSTNEGASWHVVSNGLTGVSLQVRSIDEGIDGCLYITTNGGVYKSNVVDTQIGVITLQRPNSHVSYWIGQSDSVKWNGMAFEGGVRIELNRNYPSGTWETLFANTVNDGSEVWTVTGPATAHARIRISTVNDTSINDVSDNDFVIQTLNPPANLHINAATANSLRLAWNDTISGETGFAVHRSDDGVNFHLIGTTLPDCTRYLDIPLQPNRQYWYRVYSKYQNLTSESYAAFLGVTATVLRTSTWQRIGNNGTQYSSIKQTYDGGYIATGVLNYSSGTGDLWLVKLDSIGNQVWSRNYGGLGDHSYGWDLLQTYDEGTICFGKKGNSDGWLIKTRSNGDSIFTRAYGGSFADYFESGIANPYGGYISCGYTRSYGNDDQKAWLVWCDDNGNVTNSRTYGSDLNDYFFKIQSDQSTNLWMVGSSVTSETSSSLSITKTNITGDVIWSRLYGSTGWNNGFDLLLTDDGGFVAVGLCNGNDNYTSGDVWLLRGNANGDTLWTRRFGGVGYDYGMSICLFGTGGYALTGTNKSIIPGSTSLWTIITDLNGNLIWEQAITDGSATVGNSIIQATDGDLVVAGYGNNSAYLAKIRPVSLALQSHNGGGYYQVGVSDTIRWSLTGINGVLRIQLNRNYPTGSWETLFDSTANDGVEPWRITGSNSEHARIRIYPLLFPQEIAESDTDFTIYTPLIRPNGGETFIIDEPDTIRWNFPTLTSGIATIKINRGFPNGLWQTIASSVPIAQGYRAWTPTGSLTNTARIAIIPAGANAYLADTSDANFSILPRFIQVTRPNGGELILTGQPDTIRWNAPYPGTLAIYLSRLGQDYGQLELITDSVYAPTGQYVWTPTGPISDSCYIYIGDILNPVEDWSDNRFRIVNSTITITKPNDGEVFYFGLPDTVKWSSVNLTGNVAIDLRRTVTGDWTNLFPSRPNTGQTIWWPTGTSTISAKVRVRSLLEPGTSDTSDFAFSIQNYPWSTLLRYLARNPQALSNPNAAWAPPIPYDIASNNYPPLEVAFPEQVIGHANPDSVVTSYTAIANDELSISRSINRIWSVAPSNQQFENATLTLRFVQTDLPPTIADPTTVNPPLHAVYSEDDESTWIFIPGGTVYRDTVNNNSFRFVITGLNHMSEWALTNGGLRPVLTYPNGGETLTIGDSVTFRWSNAIRGGFVSIAINRTYPNGQWETILSNTPNDSLEQWLVSGDVTINARFRIVSEWFASDGDTTNAAVSIQSAPNPPRAPENVTITPIGNHMRLQWSQVDSSTANLPVSVTGYRIDYRDDVLHTWSSLSTVEPMTIPSYIDSNAVLQTPLRFYQIHALLNTTDAVSTDVNVTRPHSTKPLSVPEDIAK